LSRRRLRLPWLDVLGLYRVSLKLAAQTYAVAAHLPVRRLMRRPSRSFSSANSSIAAVDTVTGVQYSTAPFADPRRPVVTFKSGDRGVGETGRQLRGPDYGPGYFFGVSGGKGGSGWLPNSMRTADIP
jgi:hypothetical protein